PRKGETIYIDNIRLSKDEPGYTTPFRQRNAHFPGEEVPFYPKLTQKLKVLGTDWEVATPVELGDKLKDRWTKPTPKTVDQLESESRTRFHEARKTHPHARMTILRDGEKGHDPANPDKIYAGWKDAYMNGHDPGSVLLAQVKNRGKEPTLEFFLRRRCPLVRV